MYVDGMSCPSGQKITGGEEIKAFVELEVENTLPANDVTFFMRLEIFEVDSVTGLRGVHPVIVATKDVRLEQASESIR